MRFPDSWSNSFLISFIKSHYISFVGHSLGARLLTVLTTADQNQPAIIDTSSSSNKRRRGGKRREPPPYKSFCLISFTNLDANLGIPGLGALLKQSKRGEQRRYYGKQQRNKKLFSNANNSNDNRTSGRKRRRSSSGAKNRSRYDDDDYAYDEYNNKNEEWLDLVDDLQDTVNGFRTALTLNSKDLEFSPTPDQLWMALENDCRYNVNETLIVQFDDDPIDQSSKLASILHSTNSSNVKFARLRGTHLDPVSISTNSEEDHQAVPNTATAGGGRSVATGLGALIEKAIQGNNKNRKHEIAMRDLRQSIISYITDVVTKP